MDTRQFAELGLSPKLLAAVEAAGYQTATPIQSAAIPVALTGRDVLGIAQTGTGKTAAFTLPMICRLETGRARARMPRSLILAPTRELAAQVAQAFEKYGVNHKLDVALLIGGVSMDDQVKKLDRGVDVLIATPGRLLDHFQRGRVMLMGVEILVIDEADRMLDMGFIPDIEKICKLLPPRRQTLFFSATMPPEITRLVDQFLKDPLRIEVAKPATTAKTITQRFRFCTSGEDWAKRELLRDLIRAETIKNAIIFCNRKRDVAILHKSLVKHGFNAGALHGDMDQKARMDTLDRFRNGDIMLLAASDVAARGLDIPDVSHVFNFDLPWQSDDYVHRIGRTGRAGREGVSVSLVTVDDLKVLKDIERITGDTITWIGDAPTEDDLAEGARKKRRGRGGRGDSRGGERRESREGRGGGERREGHGGGERREGRGGGDRREGRSGDGRSDRPRRERGEGGERQRPDRTSEPRTSEQRTSEQRNAEHRGEGQRGHREPRRDAPGLGEQPGLAAEQRERQVDRHAERHADRSPDRQARPRPEARQEARQDSRPRDRDRDQEPQRPRGEGKPAQPQRERSRDQRAPERAASGGGNAVGFADNIPAFLRKPPRPLKAGT